MHVPDSVLLFRKEMTPNRDERKHDKECNTSEMNVNVMLCCCQANCARHDGCGGAATGGDAEAPEQSP
jgi:hypothetical protein